MDVAEAVSIAKRHVAELFKEEGIVNLGLEEAYFDEAHDEWNITLGFSRSWNNAQNLAAALTGAGTKRSYKTVRISDRDRQVKSLENYAAEV